MTGTQERSALDNQGNDRSLRSPWRERVLLFVGLHLGIVGYYVIIEEILPDVGSQRHSNVWTPGIYFAVLGVLLLAVGAFGAAARRHRRGPLIPPLQFLPQLFAVVGIALILGQGLVPRYR